MQRRILLIALSAVLFALALAACSGSAVAPTPVPPPTRLPSDPILPSAGTPASAATQELIPTVPLPMATPLPEDDWERTQSEGRLPVGSSLDNPPYGQYDENFRPDGFDSAVPVIALPPAVRTQQHCP